MISRVLIAFVVLLGLPAAASAQDMYHPGFKPDDRVMFDLSAEDWVTTKTAHVTVNVEAAVTANTAGSTRTDMTKALDSLAKADWRLTSFERNQDQTGMERWSASFEARLPESALGGLNESAKKLSKAGLQLSVNDIDFSPTLDEMETARGGLRAQIYKMANDQLAALNAAMPGRNYRIALVDFTGGGGMAPVPQVMRAHPGVMMAMASPAVAPEPPPVTAERAEKISLNARIVFAATDKSAAASDTKH